MRPRIQRTHASLSVGGSQPIPVEIRAPGPAWTHLSPGRPSKTDNRWRHASGWEVHHCGHPTAVWPYWLRDPARPDDTVVSHNGKGFSSAHVARRAVELIVEGVLEASGDQCTVGTRRVIERARSAA